MQLEHLKVISSQLSGLILLLLVIDVNSVLRLCGDELPTTLESICHMGQFKGFNSKLKRAMDEENGFDVETNALAVYDDASPSQRDLQLDIEDHSMLHRMFGLSESGQRLVSTRRRRFGIYDECCLKACTYGELISYCRI
ncbi:probable insulin-like peptide 3 [Drosophila willistoni]|uniref:probable insulin-like peptide 3 n=1 Tax=Drosophila willistoni TaxID=7260 RepID=UPI001F076EB6|nr:probable insulin-like peptide 3 [Drosophila willistoni]